MYRKVWQKTFALFLDPVEIEIRDLTISCDRTLAFSYCFPRLSAMMKDWETVNYWERLTCCFQKQDDKPGLKKLRKKLCYHNNRIERRIEMQSPNEKSSGLTSVQLLFGFIISGRKTVIS